MKILSKIEGQQINGRTSSNSIPSQVGNAVARWETSSIIGLSDSGIQWEETNQLRQTPLFILDLFD